MLRRKGCAGYPREGFVMAAKVDSELVLCECCQEMVALRRRPRFNGRGRRIAKIHALERDYQQVPMLRLTGKWLAKANFEIGQPIEIEVEDGKLLIMIDKQSQHEAVAATGELRAGS